MPNIIEITDFNAPELDIYARLTENQLLNRHEPEKGIFIAESPKVVERALDAGYTPISLLLEKKHISGEAKHIVERCKDIPIYTAKFDVLTELTGFKLTRGVLAAMYRKALPSIESVCDNAKRIAVLDSVMNPTNVGAIFRSAAALGIDGILLTSGSSNPLYRRAIRVSMGTVFQIPWTFIDDINTDNASVIDTLKNLGFKTAAMALKDNSVNINDPNLLSEDKLAIILGTEGDGLSETTISSCDYTVCIPMFHQVDSLNVATASAIAFWELGKSKQ